MPLICDSFKKSPRCFIVQSLLASAVIGVILIFTTYVTQSAVVAAFGASTFLAFALPQSVPSRPKKIIGGYVIGITCGVLFWFILTAWPISSVSAIYDFVPLIGGAFAVGLSIFMMTTTSNEHPPASGVALSFAVSGWAWETVAFILIFAITLALVKKLLARRLVNLF